MPGMGQSNCCCESDRCKACSPDVEICCLQATHDIWVINPILLSIGSYDYYSGDTCPVATPSTSTNLCGSAHTLWDIGPYPNLEAEEPSRPMWDTTHHSCMPRVSLQWKVSDADCDVVQIRVGITSGDSRLNKWSPTQDVARNWYTGPVVFADPYYTAMNTADPTNWPLPIPEISFEVCPTTFLEFPEPDDRVYLHARSQVNVLSTGDGWVDTNPASMTVHLYEKGNCVCSMRSGCKNSGNQVPAFGWRYEPYTDTVQITVYHKSSGRSRMYAEVPYASCTWPDEEIYAYPLAGVVPPSATVLFRWKITRTDTCEGGGGNPPPPVPEKFCYARRLCVLLSVDEGASYSYYSVNWNGIDEQYSLAASPVPGGKPYTIEFTLEEDPGSLPGGSPAGSRAWVLTVRIRETGGTLVTEYSEVYVLDCRATWNRVSTLEVPITPAEEWTLEVATNCPDPPDPPPCDPGCWPECLKCPDPLDVALVISEDPDCCAANTYGMSYNSGLNRYEIAGPVGGPAGVCASITYFRMTCASSTTVTFTWQYVNVNGSTHDRTDTVDVTCGEGTFETDAVDVLSTLFSPGLCEGGFGKGANVRVVSV